MNVSNLISGSYSFSKPSLHIWKFLVHLILKPSMQDFDHNLSSIGDGGLNILIPWHCPSLVLEQKLTFSSPVDTAAISKFAGIYNAAL